ncbi:MAG: ArsC/Spx/MgsR family protein, partial [Pseudomonadota bacterium]|nr:ArsC/Spx/MgsR family protein [Pseudomonadota bacterium]
MINIYGLKNCDSCRKASKWLDNNGPDYNFYDFKNFSLSDSLLSKWIEIHSLEKILNKRSTTWRNLDEISKNN